VVDADKERPSLALVGTVCV